MSGSLEDGDGSCEDQTGEGRRSGGNVSGDGESEDEGVATGDESGDEDDERTTPSEPESEAATVTQDVSVRDGEVSEPED